MPASLRFPLPRRFLPVSFSTALLLASVAAAQLAPAPPVSPASTPAPALPTPQDLLGRYPLGDLAAPIQIVVFADFQCGECRLLDPLLQTLQSSRKDVVVTMRHFPLCADCNPAAKRTVHEHACKAALAAEAAGIAGGATAFHRMHDWLIATAGKFTDKELSEQVQTIGLDDAKFSAAISDGSALKNVKNDIALGLAVGLHTTPMLLINGEELVDWHPENALDLACAAALKARLDGKAARVLTPVERWTSDWERQTPVPAVLENVHRWTGAARENAKVDIVLFGDFQDRGTARVDDELRAIVKSRTDARYSFRHFPADPACNPSIRTKAHPLACRFAQTAEAAAQSGGDDLYWKIHDRIFLGLRNGKGQDFTDANLRELADAAKVDPQKILQDRSSDAVSAIISADVAAGRSAAFSELPAIFVNGRKIVRFRGPGVEDDSALKAIIDQAAKH